MKFCKCQVFDSYFIIIIIIIIKKSYFTIRYSKNCQSTEKDCKFIKTFYVKKVILLYFSGAPADREFHFYSNHFYCLFTDFLQQKFYSNFHKILTQT